MRIKVTSPLVEGAANENVIKLLTKELGLKKSVSVQESSISSQPEMKTFVVELCNVQKTDSQLLNVDFLGLVFIAGLKKLTTDG